MAKKEKLSLDEMLVQALVKDEEKPFHVPSNWLWTRLGNITTIVGGGTPSTIVDEYYTNGDIAWITPADLSGYNDIYISNGKRNITRLALEKSSARLMPKDTVILSSRAPIGYVAIASNDLCTNQGFKSLLPSPIYLPKFLFFYLKQNKGMLESFASGTTFLELSGRKVSKISIPIPPFPEQQRIADLIELLFEKLDRAKELVQNTLESFENRKSVILYQAFTGELTSKWREENEVDFERNWKKKELGDLIKDGPQNGLYKPQSAYDSGNLIVRIDSFYDGKINQWNTLKRLRLEKNEIALYSLNDNDILVNRVNSIQYLGKSALVINLEETCVFESNVMRMNLKDNAIPGYIIMYLNSTRGLQELRKNAKHAVNQASINQTDVKKVLVPLPTVKEQEEVVRILNNLLENEQKAKELCDVIENIDLMKKSILARAFRGELSTNNPKEESALELLKEVLKEQVMG